VAPGVPLLAQADGVVGSDGRSAPILELVQGLQMNTTTRERAGPRPASPSDLGVVASAVNTLSWSPSLSKHVEGYLVYRAQGPDGPFELIGRTAETTYTDVPPELGIAWYRVSAVTSQGRESLPTSPVSSDNVRMVQVVGPEGGTVQPTTGTVRLEIPEGALRTETPITIEQVVDPPSRPTNHAGVSRDFRIGPAGTTFAVPVRLVLALDPPQRAVLPRSYPSDATWLQYWDGSRWLSLQGAAVDVAAMTVEVPLTSLPGSEAVVAGSESEQPAPEPEQPTSEPGQGTVFGATGVVLPHGGYTDQTRLCGYCHRVHRAPGPSLRPYPTERETCYQCHSSGQGPKIDEIQRITFGGTWQPGETFVLVFQGHATAPIPVDLTQPSLTAAAIANALLDLPNIDGSSAPPNPEPTVDGVSVTAVSATTYDVTFRNAQGGRDVPQLVATTRSSAGTVSVSTTRNGVGIYPGARTDILGAFGESWPVAGSSTRASFHPVSAPRDGFRISCRDCHTPHRDPAAYTALLRRPDPAGGYLYSPVEGPPIGNRFCTLSCHDATSPYPPPFGDHTAFQGTAHDVGTVPTTNEVQRVAVDATGGTFALIFGGSRTAALAYDVSAGTLQAALEALPAIGAGNVLVTGGPGGPGGAHPYVLTFRSALAATDVPEVVADGAGLTGAGARVTVRTTINGRPARPSGDVRCLNCHDPHASDERRLLDAREETLCLSCHTTATPNTAGGPNPPWTRGPFPGSDVTASFATPNDYSTADGNGIRIYHHPISDDADQPGGTRKVECISCHNAHLSDRIDGPTTSRAADPANVFQRWIFGWDFTSGYMSRGTNATAFCTRCHVSPTTTAPLNAGPTVPYDVRLVNDTARDADGNVHDKFAAAQWPTSRHGDPTQDPTKLTYRGCANRGLSGAACVVTCTNCHDFHGSSNAYMLRERVVAPDAVTFTVTSASWRRGVVTLTITPTHSIGYGIPIVVSGITPAGYNGSFVTTNSNAGTSITYDLAANPGTYVDGGTVTARSTSTITGFGALDTASDRAKLQTFCLTCHTERGTNHKPDQLCTACHYHGSGKL
jgi:predicted CXXCH cytochrome family protein